MKYGLVLFTVLLAGLIIMADPGPSKSRLGFRSDISLKIENLATASAGDCLKVQSDKSLAPEACGGSGTTIPSGLVTFVAAGSCPAGWSEVSALNGKFLRGTLAANEDVGDTGGSDTYTPAGTNGAPTLTMNSYTPAGTNSEISETSTAGVKVGSSSANAAAKTHTHSAPTFTGTPATLTGTVSAPTFTGTEATVIPAYTNVIFCSKD